MTNLTNMPTLDHIEYLEDLGVDEEALQHAVDNYDSLPELKEVLMTTTWDDPAVVSFNRFLRTSKDELMFAKVTPYGVFTIWNYGEVN